MLNRRSFLVSARVCMVAGSLRSNLASAAGAKLPLGIQLFVVRAEMEKDVEGTLRKVHVLGFREIEFAGYYGKSAADLAKLMKRIGFTLVSTHVGADDIASKPDSIIADAKTLGLEYIICSSPLTRKPDKAKLDWARKLDALDLDDWKANAELFNRFGEKVKAAGLTFGYHNHHTEFKRFGGQTAYDTLMGACDPRIVKIELDVGWVVAARVDPIAILNTYKDRVVALHVKDIGKLGGDPHEAVTTAVGEGTIDWKKVLGIAYANGVRHFFYEQEPPFTRPILESAKMSAEYLSKITI
jgi:sugar phosphate isomerase/epimerase